MEKMVDGGKEEGKDNTHLASCPGFLCLVPLTQNAKQARTSCPHSYIIPSLCTPLPPLLSCFISYLWLFWLCIHQLLLLLLCQCR